jgi:hypothetical protein
LQQLLEQRSKNVHQLSQDTVVTTSEVTFVVVTNLKVKNAIGNVINVDRIIEISLVAIFILLDV